MARARIVASRLPGNALEMVVEIAGLEPNVLHQLRTDLEALHQHPTVDEQHGIARRMAEQFGTIDMDRICLAFEACTGIQLGKGYQRRHR